MDRYSLYQLLKTDTKTNVIANTLFDKCLAEHRVYALTADIKDRATARAKAFQEALAIVLFHSRAPETGYFRAEIEEMVLEVLKGEYEG